MANKPNITSQEQIEEHIKQISVIFDQKLTAHRESLTKLTENELKKLYQLTVALQQAKKNFIDTQRRAFEKAQNVEQKCKVIFDLMSVRELLEDTTPERITECHKRAAQGAYEHKTAFWQFMSAALILTGVIAVAAMMASAILVFPLIPTSAVMFVMIAESIAMALSLSGGMGILQWLGTPSDTSTCMNHLISTVDKASVAEQTKIGSSRLGMFQPRSIAADNDDLFSDSIGLAIDQNAGFAAGADGSTQNALH